MKVLYNIKIKVVMKVIGQMEWKMDMELIYGIMENNLVVYGKMIWYMEEENLQIYKIKFIMLFLKKDNWLKKRFLTLIIK